MTNYGTLAILAHKPHGGQGGEAELRLMLALETFPADSYGYRRVSIEGLARQAGLGERAARRARDRLTAQGYIEHRPGRLNRHGQWRFLFSLLPDTQVSANDEPIADTLGVRNTTPIADSQVSANGPATGHLGRPQSGAPLADTEAADCGHLGRPPALSTTDNDGPVAAPPDRAQARDDRPAIEGRVVGRRDPSRPTPMPPPVSGLCRECGGHHATAECPTLAPDDEQDHPQRRAAADRAAPPSWAAPRSHPPPEIARAGAALAKQLMAERPGAAEAEPSKPRTEDERRALALRQAAQSRGEDGRVPLARVYEDCTPEAPCKREDCLVCIAARGAEEAEDDADLPPF
jgi:hypothetical protein